MWITLLLLVAYGPIICFGTVETMIKRVPQFRASARYDDVAKLESSVCGSTVLAAGVWLTGIGIFIYYVTGDLAIHARLIGEMASAVAVSFVTGFFLWRLHAHEDFKLVGVLELARAAFSFLLVVGGCYFWGLTGGVRGYVIQEVFIAVLCAQQTIKRQGPVSASFNVFRIWCAAKEGFPISLSWWMFVIQNSVDRLLIGIWISAYAVGLYGLAISLTNVFAIVPTVVGRVLYPRVNYQMHGGASDSEIASSLLRPTRSLAAAIAMAQALLLLAMPVIYIKILPKSARPLSRRDPPHGVCIGQFSQTRCEFSRSATSRSKVSQFCCDEPAAKCNLERVRHACRVWACWRSTRQLRWRRGPICTCMVTCP